MRRLTVVILLLLIGGGLPGAVYSEPTPVPPVASPRPPDLAALIQDLASSEVGVQTRARARLASLGESAAPALLAALPPASETEAEALIELLAHLRFRAAIPEIEKRWTETSQIPLKLRAAQALCRMDHQYHRYQGYILSHTNSSDEAVRLLAMQMLGYIGDRRAVEPLVAIFNDTARPDQVRQAAIWDLAHTPTRESAEALVTLVNSAEVDWFYKEIIIAALRRLAAQEGMAEIVSELLSRAQQLPVR